jgi:hypothetical protein
MPYRSARRSLVAVVAFCALAGCGTSTGQDTEPAARSTTTTTPAKPVKAYTVEELAATVGCTPEFQGKTKDFRQALCPTADKEFLLLDFQTSEGQRAWLDTAQMYGGVYLVGNRWLLSSSSKDYMYELSETLGGTVEESPMRGPTGS